MEAMMNINQQSKHSQKGQSFVELAVALTALMILLAGAIDIGRAYFTFIALRDAAQEGALFGATNPEALSSIESRVRNTSNLPVDLTDTADIDVDITVIGAACMGNTIQVDV